MCTLMVHIVPHVHDSGAIKCQIIPICNEVYVARVYTDDEHNSTSMKAVSLKIVVRYQLALLLHVWEVLASILGLESS